MGIFFFAFYVFVLQNYRERESCAETYLSGQEWWDSKVDKRLLRQGM